MGVSFIMTSYNYAPYISEAVESVIRQTNQNWELIVVDDGSSDNSVEIIKSHLEKDPRIKLFTHEGGGNKGLKKSVLLALSKAKGDWVAFLESDDFLEPDYLEEKLAAVKKFPEAKLIYNDVDLFGEESQPKKKYIEWVKSLWKKDKEPKNVFDLFGSRNIIPTFSCVMCKKDILLSCNFDTPCETVLDYWLWWQIAQENKFYYIDEKLTNWRQHKNSYFSSNRSLSYFISRSAFVPEILKILHKRPKLHGQNRFENHKLLSVIKYTAIFIKKKLNMASRINS